MNKTNLSDNNIKKGSKGFYAALGISAVMIGSACFFAYGQGGGPKDTKLAPSGTVVDKKSDDVPKTTSYQYTVTTVPRTTAVIVTTTVPAATKPRETVTVPAAEISVDAPPVRTIAEAAEVPSQPAEPAAVSGLENVKPPLADTGTVLEPFSGGELVKSKTTGSWQTHNGTDFKAEVGAEVFAVSSGEIMKIENNALWGITVTLDHHNGYVTRYCGLGSDLSVQEGDVIAGGDLVGVVGNTADIESGEETHLHLEITHNGSYVDPVSLLK